MKKKMFALVLTMVMISSVLSGCSAANKAGNSSEKEEDTGAPEAADQEEAVGEQDFSGVTLTMMTTNETVLDGVNAVIARAEEKFGFEIELDITGSGGEDYNNLVRTRLASGDMEDLLIYNSGALFEQLNPGQYFVDISDNDEIMERLDETFVDTVSIDGCTYGVPFSSSAAGCILYNKEIYEELGLDIPHTWEEFLDNCKKIQESGQTPVIGAFGDGWPGIVTNFGDYYNVYAEYPEFAEDLTAGTAKWATTPAGVESFRKCGDIAEYMNDDFMSTGYNDACELFANGDGAHWIILTQVLSNIYSMYGEEAVDKIGAFGIPGNDPDNHGLTVWMPGGVYINKDSEYMDAARAFVEFYISEEALNLYSAEVPPDGPYCIKGYDMPEDTYAAVKEDLQAYFDNGKTWPALEFSSPLEGTEIVALIQQITLGEITAEEAAAAYDLNLESSALQLGLEWD